jgi:uncharacterized protein with ParB-like and HNH nuclease domain
MKIKCIDKEVKDILDSAYYKIPRFQRPYLWDRENVEEFWSDSVVEENGEHFIGSIVVYESKDEFFGVVDGQQRLTTITMILCALRNEFAREGYTDFAEGTHQLIERKDINNKSQFVLQSETSYPYLQEYIQKFGTPEAESTVGEEEINLKNAFTLIEEKIHGAIESINADTTLSHEKKKETIRAKLIAIRNSILTLKLIFIELDDEDDAYVIFETLNTRGKDLRPTDLVKNHLSRLTKPKNDNVDLTKDKWNSIVELIEASSADISTDSFLHHFWLSQYDYTTAKKLFKAVRRKVNKGNARDFLDSLLRDSRVYREINETGYGKWGRGEISIRESLNALNLFKVKQDMPMLLSVMREYHTKKLTLKHIKRILTAIENFHFLFTAVTSQRSSGGISLMYALHARELYAARSKEEKIRVLDELIKKLRSKAPSYDEFEINFLELRFSRKYTKQRKLVEYILAKMDQNCRRAGTPVDYEKMTIEHVASENPASGKAKLSDSVVAQLGNLILVDQTTNQKLANRDFNEKKRILLSSSAWVDEGINRATTWGAAQVQSRTKALANMAYKKIWRI